MTEAEVQVVKLDGMLDVASCEGVANRLIAVEGSVSVDLARVSFIDSTGLGQLVTAWRQKVSEGNRLQVINAQGHARALFEIAGLQELLGD